SIRVNVFEDLNGDGTPFGPGLDNLLGNADDTLDPGILGRVLLERENASGVFETLVDSGFSINGVSTFSGLQAGNYRLTATAFDVDGTTPSTIQSTLVTLASGQSVVPIASSPPPANEVVNAGLNFGFARQSITVSIFDDLDNDGTPIGPGADNQLGTADDTMDPASVTATRVVLELQDALGVFMVVQDTGFSVLGGFTFTDLKPGQYRLTAISSDATLTANTTQPVMITLAVGQQFVPAASDPQPLGQIEDVNLAFGFVPIDADLAITGDGVDPRPSPGESFTETFTVTNLSAFDATDVEVNLDFDGDTIFDSGSTSLGNLAANNNDVIVTIATLPAGTSATITVNLTIDPDANPDDQQTTTASVSAATNDPNVGNNVADEIATIPDVIIAASDTLNIDEDEVDAALRTINLIANDTSVESLTVVSISAGSLGTATILAGGESALYTPNPNAFGRDVLNYTVSNIFGETATGNLTVNLTAVNDPPVATDDSVAALTRDTLNLDVTDLLANDSFGPANENQTLTVSSVVTPSSEGGTVSLVGNTISYTPAASFIGLVDTFQYTLFDGVDTTTATVTISLPDPPVDLSTSIAEDIDPLVVDSTLTLTVPIVNRGLVAATNVVSTITLPAEFVASVVEVDQPGTINFSGNTATVNLAGLAAGQTATVTLIVNVGNTTGDFTTTTSVTSDEVDANLNDNNASQTTRVTLAGGINGHIFCDANGDGDEDSGEEVVGTLVFLDVDGDRILDPGEMSTQTDAGGDYSFSGLPSGSVTVVVQVPPSCSTIPSNPGISRSIIDVGDLARRPPLRNPT
ncbi:MAG: Ig-like domain-containing protein, partial [Pirellulales bacterium]|nr:Ig-like domain-containing protein [Pirellulales bacterium]